MTTFEIGSRVFLKYYGVGSVGWIGTEQIGVVFDSHGKILLRQTEAGLRPATTEDEQVIHQGNSENGSHATEWPRSSLVTAYPLAQPVSIAGENTEARDGFFVIEDSDEDRHHLRAHWKPFFDDAENLVKHLPALLRMATANAGYGGEVRPPPEMHAPGERGLLLMASTGSIANIVEFSWPPFMDKRLDQRTGIALVVALAKCPGDPNEFRSIFPYSMDGSEHVMELQRVDVWPGGVEAQLTTHVGSAVVAFFDTEFVANRDWYSRGGRYQFTLVGIAYDAGPAQTRSFTIPRTAEYFESMQWLTGEDRRPASGDLHETFSTEEFVCLLPMDGLDRDDCEFCGQIEAVTEMTMLGQWTWCVRAVVMRGIGSGARDDDFALDILVTEKAWGGSSPPQVGEFISGHLWLQGRMSQPLVVD